MKILCNFTCCMYCENVEMLHGQCEHPNGVEYNIKNELLTTHESYEIKSCTMYRSKED